MSIASAEPVAPGCTGTGVTLVLPEQRLDVSWLAEVVGHAHAFATSGIGRHATGAASSVTLSLTSPVEMTEAVFCGSEGRARMPGNVDVAAAYGAAIDALLAGNTRFDAEFGREVVRVLALANERLL